MRLWCVLGLLVLGCDEGDVSKKPPPLEVARKSAVSSGPASTAPDPDAPGAKVVQPAVKAEAAPPASPRLATLPPLDQLTKATKTYFEGHIGHRLYTQVDKPLYQPGETIWLKVWDLDARNLQGNARDAGVEVELVSPKGAVVLRKRVKYDAGTAAGDFELPSEAQGGEYHVRVMSGDGTRAERPIIVSAYEPPRIKKKLEFVRKAYGAGDEVTATIEVKRPTGEPLANHALTGAIRLDDLDLPRVSLSTNEEGGGIVRFTLPANIARGDGLLTVLVEDGGVTESVSKRIPIVLKKLQVRFFPEGGSYVEGLPGRLYFEIMDPIEKPADAEGRIVDDLGNTVAEFRTYDRGLGRVDFTPATGRKYHGEITRPVGITEKYHLPYPNIGGCALHAFDDLDGAESALRMSVTCAEARKVVVIGMMRENMLDAAALEVKAGEPAIVYLESKDAALDKAQGIARVTLFDEKLQPMAERIVYRNRRNSLKVTVEPDQETYVPREQVALKVTTKNAAGEAQQAELALSVVDDTVISFADDKTGHMLSRLFLEPEIPGELEEPNFYFDLTEAKSGLAMELLMGTHGYRRFEWQPVLNPPPPVESLGMFGTGQGGGGLGIGRVDAFGMGALGVRGRGAPPPPMPAPGAMPEAPMAAPVDLAMAEGDAPKGGMDKAEKDGEADGKAPVQEEEKARGPKMDDAEPIPPAQPVMAAEARAVAAKPMARRQVAANIALGDEIAAAEPMAEMARDEDFAGAKQKVAQIAVEWAPVRVFPAPDYAREYSGPRTDFRETIFWAPSVRTDKSGQATVTFYASDAVTSFRVFAEGAGGGLAGREEKVIQSKLPFSMNVKLPTAVSSGDLLELPLTLTNERDSALPVSLTASFGELLKLEKNAALPGPALEAKNRASLFYGLKVTGQSGKSQVSFAADAGGLKDEFVREVNVEPLGFPQLQQAAGTLKGQATHTFDLGDSLPDTATASVKLYPSPVSTLISGLEGMLQEPGGCFEQTSSNNYPNLMIAGYLKAHDVADPALTAKVNGMIDRGYQRLVGFEAPKKGYEWFGQSPAHEALTAYGLLEFADMRAVHGGVDDEMMARTARWLKERRDGKGGFQRDGQALDSFGRAGPEVTDAYIVYSLVEAGLAGDFGPEVEAQAKTAAEAKDPYVLALAANAMLRLPEKRSLGEAAAKRLAAMQGADGRFTGADHSITRSGGVNLDIETTSLAVLALLQVEGQADAVRRAVSWLNDNRSGYGQWGATQATVLALKAQTQYAVASRRTQNPGRVSVLVNGQPAGAFDYAAGRREPILIDGLGKLLRPGPNTIDVRHDGKDELPYGIAVDFRALKPATHPEVAVELKTTLERDSLPMGENVRLNVTVKNRTANGQPMTVARVGLPGGLAFQTWQLKELVDKKIIGFYETRAREVVLYFRDLAPNAVHDIPLDLVASVPGTYTGPASRAYLYYTDDRKFWTDGVHVTITR